MYIANVRGRIGKGKKKSNKQPFLSYPRECIFSNMDIASMAIQATISVDMLELTTKKNH
jgi:hypothetical protein